MCIRDRHAVRHHRDEVPLGVRQRLAVDLQVVSARVERYGVIPVSYTHLADFIGGNARLYAHGLAGVGAELTQIKVQKAQFLSLIHI